MLHIVKATRSSAGTERRSRANRRFSIEPAAFRKVYLGLETDGQRKMWATAAWVRAAVLVLAGLAGWSLAGPMAEASAVVVTDVRVAVHEPDVTRLVLEFSDSVTFEIFTLADPHRVVIDLPEVGWRLPQKPLPRHTGLVEQLRYGLFKPGNSRVVLDVNGPSAVRQAHILEPTPQNGPRLVVDLVIKPRETAVAAPARAAPPPPTETASLKFQPPLRKPQRERPQRVVVLDPGHGGIDPGAISLNGVYEKHITLAMARAVKAELEAKGGFKVVLTRDRDVFIRLRERVEFARRAGGELFISLHADAIKDASVRGFSVYTLSERASDTVAEELAEKENKADLIAGVDFSDKSPEVANILIDLAQRETMNDSARFAAGLVDDLRQQTRTLRNSHRFAGFAVLKAPDIPSVLIELGFLSNPQDEAQIRNTIHRDRLAKTIARAIRGHFQHVEEAKRN